MADRLAPARDWIGRRTSAFVDAPDTAGLRVGVILPARNEEATVGEMVTALLTRPDLIGEVIVVDSRSTDGTASAAAEAGARVVTPDLSAPDAGKGEAMRAGAGALGLEVGVFLDADLSNFDPHFVDRLVAPLAADPTIAFVKGYYERPGQIGGGRVTELVARALIAERAPQLAGFVQPLAGECAFRRDALRHIPWVSGYGVDLGLLLHLERELGLAALAQADLGVRHHKHQDLGALARMGAQVRGAVALVESGEDRVEMPRVTLTHDTPTTLDLREERVPVWLLPPLAT